MGAVTIRLRRVSVFGMVLLSLPATVAMSLYGGFRYMRGSGEALAVTFFLLLLLLLLNAVGACLWNALMRVTGYPLTVEAEIGRDVDTVIDEFRRKRRDREEDVTASVRAGPSGKAQEVDRKVCAKTQPMDVG